MTSEEDLRRHHATPSSTAGTAPGRRTTRSRVARSGPSTYEVARPTWNGRFDVRPADVVACGSTADVTTAVADLVARRAPFAVRAGGHDFADHSSSAGTVVDLSGLDTVELTDAVVRVGGGARLEHVYQTLDAANSTLPGGTCPAVGIAGLALGGGLGILGRRYGLLADRLVAAQVVLADGRVLTCDSRHHADLFWALRGAGTGSFGVVTRLDFRVVPDPRQTTNVHATWPVAAARRVLSAWQHWAPAAPWPLAASLKLTVPADLADPPHLDLWATCSDATTDLRPFLDDLARQAGCAPDLLVTTASTYGNTRQWWADPGRPDADETTTASVAATRGTQVFAKSAFFARPMTARTAAGLVEVTVGERTERQVRELDFTPWRGAYNRVRPHETAFVHRDEAFLLKYTVDVAPDATTAERDAARDRVARMWASAHTASSGHAYQNFADPDLVGWVHAYHGANLPRLQAVKTRYDPTDTFHHAQSIPLGTDPPMPVTTHDRSR